MEVKPGYKQTEVGVIPQDWEVKRFAELFVFRNGVNADKAAYGQGVRFINVLEPITYSHIHGPEITGHVTLPESILESYAVRRGDVLFNRTSETQEEVALAATYLGTERVVFGGFVIRGRPIAESFDPVYAGYALRAPCIRSQIIPMGQGAVRSNVGQENLGRVLAPIPSLPEQRAIATALGEVDQLLNRLDRLITKKRDLKQTARQQLLTSQTRLPGFHGDWVEQTLGDIVEKIVGGGTPSRANPEFWGNEVPWITVKDFATFNPRQSQESITHLGLRNSASHLIPAGTLITSTRMALGKAVVYEVDVAINQDLKALFLKPGTSVIFLTYWFEHFGNLIDELGSGSTVKGISLVELRRFPFRAPVLPEQIAIASTLSEMDAELAGLERCREKANAIKHGMMQQLLTGKVRLV